MSYHAKRATDVLKELETKKNGLSSDEAHRRRKQYGGNIFSDHGAGTSRFSIFLSQWKNPLILILLGAAGIGILLRDVANAIIIGITATLNASIGFLQEDKANRALKKLKAMIKYKAIVRRDGKLFQISSNDIVVGDILLLSPGDRIQADGRILHAVELEVNEAALTGESNPIKKVDEVVDASTLLADRTNMVYRGTVIASGTGEIVVTAIGRETEIGHIASLVQETREEKTPLQQQLALFARTLGWIVAVVAVSLIFLGLLRPRTYGLLELLQTAIAVAVAAIPEGLVISLTVILAIGMQHILRRRALVRQLMAAETLGSVNVICTDKTGTLTMGNMEVVDVVTKQGRINRDSFSTLSSLSPQFDDIRLALRVSVLCNNTKTHADEDGSQKFFGGSTETALVRAGATVGLVKEHLDETIPRIAEIPFTSERKYMATMHHIDHESVLYVKGAPEIIFERSSFFEERGESKPMTDGERQWFRKKVEEDTARGLRVLAVSYKRFTHAKKTISADDMTDLVCVGFIGIADPIRPDVKKTIDVAMAAGISIVMVTGDHRQTAESVARELGLPIGRGCVVEGRELKDMSADELRHCVRDVTIFARVSPEDKIHIVQAWQSHGAVVAMTGDGVNDAPALKAADIGIALGSGTDVAKETSDLILLDDSFTTIIAAIEEGRRIHQNIKKVILYLLSGSFAEVLLVVASIVGGLPLAILPAQILWVNIVEEALPTMALAFDRGDPETMKDRPRRRGESILDRPMKFLIGFFTLFSNIALIGVFIYYIRTTGDVALTRTVLFAGLGMGTLLYIFSIRSLRQHLWQRSPFDNPHLVAAILGGILLLLLAIYVPPITTLLDTVPLSLADWSVVIIFSLFNIFLMEAIKLPIVRKQRHS